MLNPDDGYAHFYRWETRNRLNQYMDAVKDAHRALDIDNSTFYPHIFGTHRCDVDSCGSVQNHTESHRHIVTLPKDSRNSFQIARASGTWLSKYLIGLRLLQ